MGRHKIKQETINSRVYKYMHQDRIFYYETKCKWLFKRPQRNWKYWRKKKWKKN